MYQKRFYTVLLLLAVLFLPFIGCSSSSGGSDTPDTPPAIELPTMDTIVGSWTISETTDKRDEKDYDRDKNVDEIIGQETESITFTFNADGTFLATQKESVEYISGFYPNSIAYGLKKGSYSISADGILTINLAGEAFTNSIEDPDKIVWTATTSMESVSYAIIGNALYPYVFSRVGDGSGLVGTWEGFSSSQDSLSDPIEYERTLIEITESTITKQNYYKDTDEWVLDDEETYAYAPRTATTITVTAEPGTVNEETYVANCFLDEDFLYIDYDDNNLVLVKDDSRHAGR